METLTCVQALVSAAVQYRNVQSDDNLVHLQRQLDVLISITNKGSSLDFFNPKQLLPLECLRCLVEIMNDQIAKNIPALSQKVMTLLRNLGTLRSVADILHTTFDLLSVLTSYLLKMYNTQDANIHLCMKLMQKISYGCQISADVPYVEQLIRFLIQQIEQEEIEKTPWILGLMANLCHKNFTIQTYVKGQERLRQFYKKLCSFLTSRSQKLVLFALSLITSLCLHDEVGQKVMNAQNIHKTFQLLFNIIVNNQSLATRQIACDLFTDLIQMAPYIQQTLINFEHLDACLLRVISLLSHNSHATLNQILELLNGFCAVGGLRSAICRLIVMRPTDVHQTSALICVSQLALASPTEHTAAVDLLRYVSEELLDADDNDSDVLQKLTDIVLRIATQTLSGSVVSDTVLAKYQLIKRLKVVQLLISVCCDDELRHNIATQLDVASLCSSLIEQQLSRHACNGTRKMILWSSGDVEDSTEASLDIVLHLLDLMIHVRSLSSGISKSLEALLQNSRLIPFLVTGLKSENAIRIQLSIKIIIAAGQLTHFPSALLCDSLSICNHEKSCVSGHVNVVAPCRLPSVSNANVSNTSIDSSVQMLISKMNSGLELRDTRASEIIAIYEHRLQSLQTKESYMQDMLDAKISTLAKMDRLLAQYRVQIAENEVEANKLRLLLHDAEKSVEQYRERLNNIQSEFDAATQENTRLHEIAENYKQLKETSTVQAQNLEAAQRSLSVLHLEHKSLVETHELLKGQYETLRQQHEMTSKHLEEECKTLKTELKDKTARVEELTKSVEKLDDRCNKLSNDNVELESAVDTLRTELARAQQTKKELQHQVTSLEVVCRQQDSTLKENEQQIRSYRAELDKHAQIAALIHSLSGGKPPAN